MQTFFDMGGHGAFIWPAYGVSALLICALIFHARRRLMRARRDLERAQQADADRGSSNIAQ